MAKDALKTSEVLAYGVGTCGSLLLALGIVAVAVFAMYAHDVLMMYLCTYDFGAEDAIAPIG